MIKVLLVSPLDPDKPSDLKFLMGGENTFTRTLLSYPPKGVKYIHQTEALKLGLIKYLPIHKVSAALTKFRILPPAAGTQAFLLKDDFDLIHVHAYSLKIEGLTSQKLHGINKKIPIIISDSSSNYLFLRDYLRWPGWRIKIGLTVKKMIFERLSIFDSDTNLGTATKLVVFSKFAAGIHQDLGIPADKIKVIYPGLPKRKFKLIRNKSTINILFAGVWFERKGGQILLEAFKVLSRKFANIKLIILGPVPKKFKYEKLNIFQKDFVPYSELLEKFYPEADIFVLVPPKAEGYGLVVEEAASFGIPSIVSRVYALPELVEDGKTGFVVRPGSLSDLVERLEILVKNTKLRQKMGEAAREKFEEQFTIEKSNQKLLSVYEEVLAK